MSSENPPSPSPGSPRRLVPVPPGEKLITERQPLPMASAALPKIKEPKDPSTQIPWTVAENHESRTFTQSKKVDEFGEVQDRPEPIQTEKYLGSINPRWLPRVRKVGLDNPMALSRDVILKSRSTSPPKVKIGSFREVKLEAVETARRIVGDRSGGVPEIEMIQEGANDSGIIGGEGITIEEKTSANARGQSKKGTWGASGTQSGWSNEVPVSSPRAQQQSQSQSQSDKVSALTKTPALSLSPKVGGTVGTLGKTPRGSDILSSPRNEKRNEVKFRLSRTTLPGQNFFVLETAKSPRRGSSSSASSSSTAAGSSSSSAAGPDGVDHGEGKNTEGQGQGGDQQAETGAGGETGEKSPKDGQSPKSNSKKTNKDDLKYQLDPFYEPPLPDYNESPTSPWCDLPPIRADLNRRAQTLSAKRMEEMRHLKLRADVAQRNHANLRKKPHKSGVMSIDGVVSPRHRLFIDQNTGLVLNPNSPTTKKRIEEAFPSEGESSAKKGRLRSHDLREVHSQMWKKDGRKKEFMPFGVPMSVLGVGKPAPGALVAPHGTFTPYRLLTPVGRARARVKGGDGGDGDNYSSGSEMIYDYDGRKFDVDGVKEFEFGGRDPALEAGRGEKMLGGRGLAGTGAGSKGQKDHSPNARRKIDRGLSLGSEDNEKQTEFFITFNNAWFGSARSVMQNGISEKMNKMCKAVVEVFDEFVSNMNLIHRLEREAGTDVLGNPLGMDGMGNMVGGLSPGGHMAGHLGELEGNLGEIHGGPIPDVDQYSTEQGAAKTGSNNASKSPPVGSKSPPASRPPSSRSDPLKNIVRSTTLSRVTPGPDGSNEKEHAPLIPIKPTLADLLELNGEKGVGFVGSKEILSKLPNKDTCLDTKASIRAKELTKKLLTGLVKLGRGLADMVCVLVSYDSELNPPNVGLSGAQTELLFRLSEVIAQVSQQEMLTDLELLSELLRLVVLRLRRKDDIKHKPEKGTALYYEQQILQRIYLAGREMGSSKTKHAPTDVFELPDPHAPRVVEEDSALAYAKGAAETRKDIRGGKNMLGHVVRTAEGAVGGDGSVPGGGDNSPTTNGDAGDNDPNTGDSGGKPKKAFKRLDSLASPPVTPRGEGGVNVPDAIPEDAPGDQPTTGDDTLKGSSGVTVNPTPIPIAITSSKTAPDGSTIMIITPVPRYLDFYCGLKVTSKTTRLFKEIARLSTKQKEW